MKVTAPVEDKAKPLREDGPKRRKEATDMLDGKKSKKEVNYRHGDSETKAFCSDCKHYEFPSQPASACDKVAGEVEAGDVCDLFTPQNSGQGKSTAARRSKSAYRKEARS